MKILSGGIIKFITLLIVGFIALNAILLLASNTTLTLFLFVIPMIITMVALNYSQLKRLAKGTKKKLYNMTKVRSGKSETQGGLKEIHILKNIQFYLYGDLDDVVIAKKDSTIAAIGFLALKMVPKGFRGDLNGILKTLYDENISLTYILVQNPIDDRTDHDRLNYIDLQENHWNVQALIAVHKNMKGFLNMEEKCAILAKEVRKNMFIVKTSFHTLFPECRVHKISRDDLFKALQLGIMSGGIDFEGGLYFPLRDSEVANLITGGPVASSSTSNNSPKESHFPSRLSGDPSLQKTNEQEFSDYPLTCRTDPVKPFAGTVIHTEQIPLDKDFPGDELPFAVEILRFLLDYPGSTGKHIASTTDTDTTLKILEKLERFNYVVSFANPEEHEKSQKVLLLSKKGKEALRLYSEDYRNAPREVVTLWSELMDE